MPVNVGINGFGRIGRNLFRATWERGVDANIVAVNDITDTATLAHLSKYDSSLGPFPAKVEHSEDSIIFDGKPVKVLSERDPAKLPWKDLGVDVVVESTGFFTDRYDGILACTEDPIVSTDINKSPYSSIFDSGLTMVMEGTLVKVVSWYDNEWGYSCRLADLLGKVL